MNLIAIIQEWLDDESQGRRSPEFLAEKAGLDSSAISKILAGKRVYIKPDTLNKLAKAMGIPVIRLFIASGYLKESDLLVKEKGDQIPPDIQEALKNPEMLKIYRKLWKWKIEDPPIDLYAFCDRILSLPPDQMALVEELIRNMKPRQSGV